MKIQALIVCFGVFLFASTSFGEVLYEQTSKPIPSEFPHQIATGISSSNADAIIEKSQAWDNFTLANDASIDSLTWKGAFNNIFNPDGTRGENDFFIEFYSNSTSNRPDLATPLHTFELDGGLAGINDGTQVTESIVADEIQRAGGEIVEYAADLPDFDLDAGDYWLSIQAVQTLPSPFFIHDDPQWSWGLSNEGTQGIYSYDEKFDDFKPGIAIGSANTTFALLGEFDTPPGLTGDFDSNGILEATDIDLLVAAICEGNNAAGFDLTGDDLVNVDDHTFWISDVFNTLPGDANLDGQVAFVDFLILSSNFSQTGGWAQGNFNTDKEVAFADFLILSSNFGQSAAAASAVPEPSAGLLACLAVGILAFRTRRRLIAG